MRYKWTKEEIDVALNALLHCMDEAQFNGCCDRIAARLDRGTRITDGIVHGGLVSRMAWGLAVRLQEYSGPTAAREIREGMTFTWAEVQMLRWAADTESEEAKEKRVAPPDAAYLKILLGRPVGEVVDRKWAVIGPAKGRGNGFMLPPKPKE